MPSAGQSDGNLRQQHAQLLAFNHILVEENNHRLLDHADLMSEVGSCPNLQVIAAAPSVCIMSSPWCCLHVQRREQWLQNTKLMTEESVKNKPLQCRFCSKVMTGINCRQKSERLFLFRLPLLPALLELPHPTFELPAVDH